MKTLSRLSILTLIPAAAAFGAQAPPLGQVVVTLSSTALATAPIRNMGSSNFQMETSPA